MLQAMFYYSSISNDKKEWLLHLLKERPQTDREIYQNLKKDFKENIKGIDLNDLKYPEVSTKIFYYFEYMLWEFYKDFVQGSKINLDNQDLIELKSKIENIKSLFNSFVSSPFINTEYIADVPDYNNYLNRNVEKK